MSRTIAGLFCLLGACASSPPPVEYAHVDPAPIQAYGPAEPVAQPIPECHAYFAVAEQVTACPAVPEARKAELEKSLREERMTLPAIERGSEEDRAVVRKICVRSKAELEIAHGATCMKG